MGEKCDEIYQVLKNVEHMSIYRKGYPEEDGGIPEKYHYSHHYRVPPLLINAELPYQVHVNRTSYHALQGQHGYDNVNAEMHPIFIAAGKAIKQHDSPIIEPFNSIHLYSLFCKILGV